MKVISAMLHRMMPVVVAGILSACASHHPQSGTSASSMSKNRDSADMMGGMDMKAMCDNHKNMMNARTPAERDAMMDQHMKSMSPEMRQKHMSMMDARCK